MIGYETVEGMKLSFWKNDGGFSAGRPTLLFIHGSGGSHEDWQEQTNPLQDSFNIAAIDLPGHGQSAGEGKQELFAYVETVEKFLRQTGIEKPVLIGHSLGAAICLGFAIKNGKKAAAIVPVGGGVKMPVNPLILAGLRNDPETTIAAIAKFSVTKANRERLAGRIAAAISRVSAGIIHGDFAACNRLDLTGSIGGISIPTLVVCGAGDKMTPPSLSGYLRDNIPGAKFALIEEAGHFAMLEKPKEFNNILKTFVNSLTKE